MDVVTLVRAAWDRVAGYLLIGAGLACLAFAYFEVARSPFIADQLTYTISGGLGGLVLLGAGGTLLLIADLHDEWRKLDRIEKALADGVLRWDGGHSSLPAQEYVADKVIRAPAMNGSRSRAQVLGDV